MKGIAKGVPQAPRYGDPANEVHHLIEGTPHGPTAPNLLPPFLCGQNAITQVGKGKHQREDEEGQELLPSLDKGGCKCGDCPGYYIPFLHSVRRLRGTTE